MKGILGMVVAAIIVLLQIAAVATWQVEAELHLLPVDGPALADVRRA